MPVRPSTELAVRELIDLCARVDAEALRSFAAHLAHFAALTLDQAPEGSPPYWSAVTTARVANVIDALADEASDIRRGPVE